MVTGWIHTTYVKTRTSSRPSITLALTAARYNVSCSVLLAVNKFFLRLRMAGVGGIYTEPKRHRCHQMLFPFPFPFPRTDTLLAPNPLTIAKPHCTPLYYSLALSGALSGLSSPLSPERPSGLFWSTMNQPSTVFTQTSRLGLYSPAWAAAASSSSPSPAFSFLTSPSPLSSSPPLELP